MREILFRGKRIDNGEWVYGVAFPHDNAGAVTMFFQHPLDGSLEGREVDPSTVGEYTDLTDKNGKKVFEGDIVKVSSPSGSSYYAKIEYDCGCYWVSNPDIQIPDTINNFNMDFVVVDGTIFDNPELLEVG